MKIKFMSLKKFHYYSGLLILTFISFHLLNYLNSIFGADKHIVLMNTLINCYRNIFLESILVIAILIQIYSGLKMFLKKFRIVNTLFEKIQIC